MFKKHSSFHVMYIKDVSQTLQFYKEIGAEIVKSDSNKVVVKLGDYELHFVKDITEPWEDYKYISYEIPKGSGIIIYIEVNNIEEMFNKVKSAKGEIKSEIKENWWNAKEFLFEYPDSFKFSLYQMNN